MRVVVVVVLGSVLCGLLAVQPSKLRDRFVWVFGWGLGRDEDVPQIVSVLETAAKHGYNGAVLSAGLDALCKRDDAYFRRLEEIKRACQRLGLELVPAVFPSATVEGF